MEIEHYTKYKAKVNYHRTDNLRPNVPENGAIINVETMWLMDKDDPFPDEFTFKVLDEDLKWSRESPLWLPQRDLEIINIL
jgi:hypothetical protein